MEAPGYDLANFSQKTVWKWKQLGIRDTSSAPHPSPEFTNVNVATFHIAEKNHTTLNPDYYEFGLYKTLIRFRKY